MDLQHKMLRSTINVLISKAIRDIESDRHRGIRNLVDLGVSFGKGENQKRFFAYMQNIIQDPQNPFYSLVGSIVENIDHSRITTLGINLGASSFTHGVTKIRRLESELGVHIPPMLIFDAPPEHVSPLIPLKLMSDLVAQAFELGCFTNIVSVNSLSYAQDVISVAHEHTADTFFLKVKPEVITDEFIEACRTADNVAVFMHVSCGIKGITLEVQSAFAKMREARMAFGFYSFYDEENISDLSSEDFVSALIDMGCFFGVYGPKRETHSSSDVFIHNFVEKMRSSAGKSILLFDWAGDCQTMYEVISPGTCSLHILADGTIKAKNAGTAAKSVKSVKYTGQPLNEILSEVMPAL